MWEILAENPKPPRGEHPRARVKRDDRKRHYLQQAAVEQHDPLEQQQSQPSLQLPPHEHLQSSQEQEEPQQQGLASALAV